MTDERGSLDRRLARIEGQVRGVRRLLAEGAYCCDVLNQMNAVSAALNQAKASLAVSHIRNCVDGHETESAHPSAREMSKEEVLDELSEVLQRLVR
ncbi:MAG: metal-sensitive transcriptional regulator [Fimbriimonadaceae bacterium]|nr:metal-sensitive transcriptional regulator [Fimbriimonadaceae bacterium]QYK59429.1 MAG: metal-sensitive transcriptional regulator [Fimbriimonadaceae bacterium]